jgi:hypothetical protein
VSFIARSIKNPNGLVCFHHCEKKKNIDNNPHICNTQKTDSNNENPKQSDEQFDNNNDNEECCAGCFKNNIEVGESSGLCRV